MTPLDLRVRGRYHVVGVGGPGMSAIALVLAEMGHDVSGSDLRELPVLERLRAAGVTVYVGHSQAHVSGVDAVTYSSAIPAANVELVASRAAGITTLHRSGMLASICATARGIGVAGAHGKTTTTSMLTMILTEAGLRPSFIVGGDVNDVGTGAHWSGSEWLVVEADESDRTFLELPLEASIVTNVEPDFLHNYGDTFQGIVDAFDTYLDGVVGPKVLCLDDPVAAELAGRHHGITYGTAAGADYRITGVSTDHGSLRFGLERRGEVLGAVAMPLRGLYNARNAAGAIAMAMELGAPFAAAAAALARFGGVARRFDVRGVFEGITLIDDYGHLPAEIAATLDAAVSSGDGWQRVVAVFQPNRFSRIARMSGDYRDAFVDADLAVITDIYPSGERPMPGVTGKLVVDAVLDAHPDQRVAWVPRRAELIEFLANELRAGDVCISMGCGDVANLPSELLARMGAPS
jgi:UDP-N-acetylmuramate--alanine ligase